MYQRDLPYYEDYLSIELQRYLTPHLIDVDGVDGLKHVGPARPSERSEALAFMCRLYERVKINLERVLNQRRADRQFIDLTTSALADFNRERNIDFQSDMYQSILGRADIEGRVVVGPLRSDYASRSSGASVAPIPKNLDDFHVTLFGPPDDEKLSINAMNAYHRRLKEEPPIVEELLKDNTLHPKWGADNEDSKTPLREDLCRANSNLARCLQGEFNFYDEARQKDYALADSFLSHPIKRFAGLALPAPFLFYRDNPIPLHIYDFALHLYEHHDNPDALTFYVPKLENEEEARYLKLMMQTAEEMIQESHPEYQLGTVRVIIVLENPRAVFRVNEMIDALYPYFLGASLGWHDYLGSTARLFKGDPNYRIPAKTDPDIVIKYIKASHELLVNVVGARGGIKIGGMYGVLPTSTDLRSDSFQITLRGFFRDVVTQLKRDLSGYWVAHPDFVRIGIALAVAWEKKKAGDERPLKAMINQLLTPTHAEEIWRFVQADDIEGLDPTDQLYARSLIVADLDPAAHTLNHHPDEVRYNVFQSLQYLTDWLSGNGCVALPATIQDIPVRVMDDLATAERSRWEVWHEVHHGRFSREALIRIAHEEMNFIRRDLSNETKKVQVHYTEENAKWYEVALHLMLKLMTDSEPVEFATELLMPFTLKCIRDTDEPWETMCAIDPQKYKLEDSVARMNYYFSLCGSDQFLRDQRANALGDLAQVEASIMSFDLAEINSAASFHGDIGQARVSLDSMAKQEQSVAAQSSEALRQKLLALGEAYRRKFGFKFLVSAKGKSAQELYETLETRFKQSREEEMELARRALFEITRKRMIAHPLNYLKHRLEERFNQSSVAGVQIAIALGEGVYQTLCLGEARRGAAPVTPRSLFQIASLSKTFASAFALTVFERRGISLDTSVNQLLTTYKSGLRLTSKDNQAWGDQVQLRHLLSHTALNLHYINGIPSGQPLPSISEILERPAPVLSEPLEVLHEPGAQFKYSGGGFIVLEHLMELIGEEPLEDFAASFFAKLGLKHLHFKSPERDQSDHAYGYTPDGDQIEDGYKRFPIFAAGMSGTSEELLVFLEHIARATTRLEGSGGISHDIAVQMCHGIDRGCMAFMGSRMGLGVFIVEAGDNKFLLHQGANDGFRAIYLYCYQGPDRYKGFSIMCNGELNGVILNGLLAQVILEELEITGVSYDEFDELFSAEHIPTAEVVNLGYKRLIFDAFEPRLPQRTRHAGVLDPLHAFNLACSAKLAYVSNQAFARAENLISPYLPHFDPKLFGPNGKVMDSWESTRHNPEGVDTVELILAHPSDIHYLSLSTEYHDGNHIEWVEIFADQRQILSKTQLAGHSLRCVRLDQPVHQVSCITIKAYPDGGLTRLGLFDDLPPEIAASFQLNQDAQNQRFAYDIQVFKKKYQPQEVIQSYPATRPNYTSSEQGAYIIKTGDEHYAYTINVLSEIKPIGMFDGFESKRSRDIDHSEEFVIQLGQQVNPACLRFDFTYFRNNNPRELQVEYRAHVDRPWQTLIPRVEVKAFAGTLKEFTISEDHIVDQLRVTVYPDGGINRIQLFAK